MDPKNAQDPNSPWYQNPDWTPPEGFVYNGYTWNGGQPTPGANQQTLPNYDPTKPSLGNPIPAGGIPGFPGLGTGPQPTPNTTPTPNPTGTNNNGGGNTLPPGSIGSLLTPYPGQAPSYVNPTYPAAPKFPDLPSWQSPSASDAANMPGEQFARDQALQGLNNSAAARGVTNTGGTLQDIIQFGNQFATQNYQTDRANSLEDYQTNVANKYLLPYQAAFSQWGIQNPQAGLDAQNQNTFNWNNALQNYSIYRNQKLDTTNQLFSLANLGATVQ